MLVNGKEQQVFDGKPRPIFERSPQSIAYHRVIELHKAQEMYARDSARRFTRVLRFLKHRPMAGDRGFLMSMAAQYKVMPDHRDLFCDIVEKTINKDLPNAH